VRTVLEPDAWPAGPPGARLVTYFNVKRLLDLVLALVLLLCFVPVLALCALAIRLESPGPILFRQRRVGRNGRMFTMLKLRSMYADADVAPHRQYAAAFIRGQAQAHGDQRIYKLVADPRVTRVGRWLRRTSMDELPQMSLVGPRPPIPYELELYQPAHFQRLQVRPGITGLWQVNGRSRTTFEEMVALDLDYIRNWCLALDVRILLKTIPVVLLRANAH
jgi:lipopolysaccharide/colanic/teichoic acid biosynthesis glycosyltransferase